MTRLQCTYAKNVPFVNEYFSDAKNIPSICKVENYRLLYAFARRQVFIFALQHNWSIDALRIQWILFSTEILQFTIFLYYWYWYELDIRTWERLWTVCFSTHLNPAVNCSPVDIVQFSLHPLLRTHLAMHTKLLSTGIFLAVWHQIRLQCTMQATKQLRTSYTAFLKLGIRNSEFE